MLLAFGPAVVATAPAAEALSVSAYTATNATYNARVINRINAYRVKYGRAPLRAASCPTWYAAHWSYHLAVTGTFYHQSMYPILKTCRATRVAENIARGGVSADRIVAAWMASPGHRTNILDGRLTKIGVDARYAVGQWTVAADFARF